MNLYIVKKVLRSLELVEYKVENLSLVLVLFGIKFKVKHVVCFVGVYTSNDMVLVFQDLAET